MNNFPSWPLFCNYIFVSPLCTFLHTLPLPSECLQLLLCSSLDIPKSYTAGEIPLCILFCQPLFRQSPQCIPPCLPVSALLLFLPAQKEFLAPSSPTSLSWHVLKTTMAPLLAPTRLKKLSHITPRQQQSFLHSPQIRSLMNLSTLARAS